jgi:hypothetical protein
MKYLLNTIFILLLTLGMNQPIYADTMDNVSGAVNNDFDMITISYEQTLLETDVQPQTVDGVLMVPLRIVAESLGYDVTWNSGNQTVDISNGTQWTSVSINKNSYFRNKMAPHSLSLAPVIIDNRTLVPVEFFADILGHSITIENQQINFSDDEAVIYSGYIKDITFDETGMQTILLTSDYDSDDIELQTIIHTSKAYTVYQRDLSTGDYISAASSMIMLMSMPGQTSGYIIY